MIHTFKFESKFSPDRDGAVLGTVPAGRVLKSEPILEGGKMLWLVVIDDAPDRPDPIEFYRPRKS